MQVIRQAEVNGEVDLQDLSFVSNFGLSVCAIQGGIHTYRHRPLLTNRIIETYESASSVFLRKSFF